MNTKIAIVVLIVVHLLCFHCETYSQRANNIPYTSIFVDGFVGDDFTLKETLYQTQYLTFGCTDTPVTIGIAPITSRW